MIFEFTVVQMIVAVAAGLLAIILGLAKRPPNDITVLSLALVELLLIAQVVVMIVAPGAGNPPTGNPLEAWMYLIAAVLIPPLAIFWALVERNRWSNVVLGTAALAIAVMLWRLQQIWTVQLG